MNEKKKNLAVYHIFPLCHFWVIWRKYRFCAPIRHKPLSGFSFKWRQRRLRNDSCIAFLLKINIFLLFSFLLLLFFIYCSIKNFWYWDAENWQSCNCGLFMVASKSNNDATNSQFTLLLTFMMIELKKNIFSFFVYYFFYQQKPLSICRVHYWWLTSWRLFCRMVANTTVVAAVYSAKCCPLSSKWLFERNCLRSINNIKL